MIQLRKSEERGHINHGWLDTFHTFSFGDYYDPTFMGFRDLRVINEDFVQGGNGFDTHGHRDMEIITYILEGALEHKDSMGNGSIIKPGDVQRMTAGTGVRHSEKNHSPSETVHLLQIWILPQEENLKPGYEQKFFAPELKQNKMCLVAAQSPRSGSIKIHQDAEIYAALLSEGQSLKYTPKPGRFGWVQLCRGEMTMNGQKMAAGDGAALGQESSLEFLAQKNSEFLYFDLA